jgi:hypothetical protein
MTLWPTHRHYFGAMGAAMGGRHIFIGLELLDGDGDSAAQEPAMHYANGLSLGIRLRKAAAVLTLLSHLFATFGFPLPAPFSSSIKDASQPFPCQNRPCGCLTAEQCWAGDCCCFTLEEKLAWAEANGIEPPEHVRPLVELRKSRVANAQKKSCCAESHSGSHPSSSSCCSHSDSSESYCCNQDSDNPVPKSQCPHCDPKPTSKGPSGVRWIVGIFAQNCRGSSLAMQFQLHPVIVSDVTQILLERPGPLDWVAPQMVHIASISHSPPKPPPRCS